MGTNIFGYESYTGTLGNRHFHGTIVPSGDDFLCTITVESEEGIARRYEAHFSSHDEARIDLHNRLAKMKKKESEEDGEFDTHVEESIGDVLPKSHYLSQRLAMTKSGYWINYQTGAEARVSEHEAWLRNPQNAQMIGVPPQIIADFAKFEPVKDRAAFLSYVMQHAPIMRVRGHGREISFEYSSGRSKGPLDAVWTWAQREAGPLTSLFIANLATGETTSMLYKNFVETMDSNGYEGIMRRASEQKLLIAEMVLTTHFVKKAGSTENYLQSIGVQPEVIQFVTSQEPEVAKKLVNEVRKNNQLTVDQLQQMAQQLAGKQKYEPTWRELSLANRYEQYPNMSDWVLLQLKKHRVKKRPPVGGVPMNFPMYEFEYDWMKIPELRYLTPDIGAWAIVDELDMIKDWVRATQPQLASFDFLQAKVASDKWHLEQTQQGAGQGYQEKNVTFTFKDGWTIQQVKSENDLKTEGNLMGHCVGGYCDYVASGSSSIFSLRDPQNRPHVTLEVQGEAITHPEKGIGIMQEEQEGDETWERFIPGWKIVQIQGKGNAQPIPEYKARIREWFQSLGPNNVEMESEDDTDLYSRLYSAEPHEFADLIESAANLESVNEYGLPVPPEKWDARTMENLYEQIIEMLQKQYRREHTYHGRVMEPIASALADLAWNADMKDVQGDISKWTISTKVDHEGVPVANPERIMEVFTRARSSMSGIHREMDKHQEEFDRWDFDPGFRMEDFENEEKFFEAESEARDQAYGEWMSGGFDMAINRRWQARLQEAGGKYPWDILKERLAPKKPTRKRKRNAA